MSHVHIIKAHNKQKHRIVDPKQKQEPRTQNYTILVFAG